MSVAFGFLMSVLRFGQVACSSRTLWTTPAPLSKPLIRRNRFIGEEKRSPFPMPDQGVNGLEEVFCGPIWTAEFTCRLQIVPSNL